MDAHSATPRESTGARRRLVVRGVVQGVGFRPYVYRLAERHGLSGFVRNTSLGVVIEVQGDASVVERFDHILRSEDAPPLMRIDGIEICALPFAEDHGFSILDSDASGTALPWVPADVAVCAQCLAEIGDARNRRFEYPFTNCTNCGPRYSIILDLPYDRGKTTMSGFAMCDACHVEYDDPHDRRFHAQPNACSVCGPQMWMSDACGRRVPVAGTRPILESVVNLLRAGGIVALKGLGGYQLACDAANDAAVRELRRRKHRKEKAFAVMVADPGAAERLCEVTESERRLLDGAEKPIVLLRRRADAPVAESVAPGNPLLGVMLPSTPMHALLFRLLEGSCGHGAALVMTSGNRSEEPIVIDEGEAQAQLGSIADLLVHHTRPIHTRIDDSVARVLRNEDVLLRRARGYAPSPVRVVRSPVQLLACGAHLKSTLCLARDEFAVLSQHLGDLENIETLTFFEQTLERMQRLFQIEPELVVHDMHPDYISTQFAQRIDLPKMRVQHHHAHIASCMAEHSLSGEVLGVAWDGTGFGPDGTIWGGEFLVADLAAFQRYAHLRTVPLVGGDAATRQPWRVAQSYLRDAFDNIVPPGLACQRSLPERAVRTMETLLERRVHAVETSSCGRLFDAVASLLGVYHEVSFEGQAATALEALAGSSEGAYDFEFDARKSGQVDMRQAIRQIVNAVEQGEPPNVIAARFHNTLVRVLIEVCSSMRADTGLHRVCLSGGCFQNARLLECSVGALRRNGFAVFTQAAIPCNDAGISLGQAAIAGERLRRGA